MHPRFFSPTSSFTRQPDHPFSSSSYSSEPPLVFDFIHSRCCKCSATEKPAHVCLVFSAHIICYRSSSAMALPGVSTFFLVRHGETDWNAAGRLQGQFDIPLNDRGRAQAHAAATYLVHHYALGTGGRDRATGDDASAMASALECGDVIVSSTLGRAMETAQLIGGAAGLPVFTTSELMETCLGRSAATRVWTDIPGCYLR